MDCPLTGTQQADFMNEPTVKSEPVELTTLWLANPWVRLIGRHDRVYLAGPMSGMPDMNRPTFYRWEHLLKTQGATILSPAHADQSLMYHVLIRQGLQMVLAANVTVMLHGWKDSNGANVEWAVSSMIGNRVYYEQ